MVDQIEQPQPNMGGEYHEDVEDFIRHELTLDRARENLNKILIFRDKIEGRYDLWREKFDTHLFQLDEFQIALLDRVLDLRKKYEQIKSDPNQRTYVVDEGARQYLLESGIHSAINTEETGITLAYPDNLYTVINTLGKQRRQVPLLHVDIPFEELKLYFVPSVSGGFGLGGEFMSMKNNMSLYSHIVALDSRDRILVTPFDRSISMMQLDGVDGKPKVTCGETRLSTFELCMKHGVPPEGIPHWSKQTIKPNSILTPYTGGYNFDGRNGISALATFEQPATVDTLIPDNQRLKTMLYVFASIIKNPRLAEGPNLLK